MLRAVVDDPPPRAVETEPFEALFRERYRAMVRLAAVVTGSAEVAEEIVQDAFVAVHRRWASLGEPAAFLRTCVLNGARDHQRRQGVVERKASLVAAPAPNPGGSEPDELGDALAGLPFRQRAALALRFYADLPDDEIAEALGCRQATVRSLVHRGLQALREVVER